MSPANAALYGVALLFALGVKAFYANADADALRFLLGPTAALVGVLSGQRFEAEPGMGYLSRELRFVIAPVCAGLNYFVIAFGTLVLGFSARLERPARRCAWLLAAVPLAYAATLLVNATRIALALPLRHAQWAAGLAATQAHRLEGVAVYLVGLWLLAATVERCFPGRAGAGHTLGLPLALYLGVTLGLPLSNGATAQPGFWVHAATVLAAALGLAALAALGVIARRRRSV